jgi:rod shape determining protein RodA
MFDRRLVQHFDWGLLCLIFFLMMIGLATLFSAVKAGTEVASRLYIKQAIWFGGGIIAMVASFTFNYRRLERWGPVVYGFSMAMLVAVLALGRVVSGSRRWLTLGPISIQPSEFAKIALVIILARYFAKHVSTGGLTLKELVAPAALTAAPFLLVVKQPDLGTAMMLALVAASMALFVKIEWRSLLFLVLSGLMLVPGVWFLLKDYQKLRILTFLNPDRDPLGAGYHIIQSKIAIGSGMFWGKGYLKGTQNALAFLPEQHTDFIFSVLAEEWGFVGTSLIILLFLLLVIWSLSIADHCREPYGKLLSVGLTAMIFWQVFINIGMVMGAMPVVGVPLPFISYGGSSALTLMIALGLLLNVSMRRFVID